jgi:rhodanese-related sulfurtransferase
MNTITREQLQALIGSPSLVLLEALPEAHYQRGHIPTARWFSMANAREFARTVGSNTAVPIVVYCASETCKNSHEVAKLLGDVGYTDVRVYVGGKADWESAGLTLEK